MSSEITADVARNVFRDGSRTVHKFEDAAQIDLGYNGLLAASKTTSDASGVKKSDAEHNRRTLSPAQFYCAEKGQTYPAAAERHRVIKAAVARWDGSVGLLGLDIVLPFSKATVPRLAIVSGLRGRKDMLVHVDQANLHLLVGQDAAEQILGSLRVTAPSTQEGGDALPAHAQGEQSQSPADGTRASALASGRARGRAGLSSPAARRIVAAGAGHARTPTPSSPVKQRKGSRRASRKK